MPELLFEKGGAPVFIMTKDKTGIFRMGRCRSFFADQNDVLCCISMAAVCTIKTNDKRKTVRTLNDDNDV